MNGQYNNIACYGIYRGEETIKLSKPVGGRGFVDKRHRNQMFVEVLAVCGHDICIKGSAPKVRKMMGEFDKVRT